MDNFIVFEVLSNRVVPIGIIENFVSLMYTDYYNDTGSFELEIPFSTTSFNLLKRSNDKEKLILLDNRFSVPVFGICHKVCPQNSTDKKTISVQGTLIEGLLDNYSVGKIERLKTASTSPQNLLNFPLSLQYELQNLPDNISGDFWSGITYNLPSDYQDSSWEFPDGFLGGQCTFNDYIGECSRQLKKGYCLEYNKQAENFALKLYSPKDRTLSQQTNSPVLISTQFGDVISSQYYLNSKNYKNIIVAHTTLDDTYYEQVVTYDDMTSAYPTEKKRVAYKDIVEVTQYDESGQELSSDDINGLLRQFGKKYLYEAELCSEYSCKLSQDTKYKYRVDYQLGDKITIQDTELGVIIDACVSGCAVTISRSINTFEPIIGVSQPSLTRILKQKGMV